MFVDKDDLIVINSIYLGMIDYCIVLMKNNGMMWFIDLFVIDLFIDVSS